VFTGIIERIGRLGGKKEQGGGYSLEIEHDPWDTPLVTGESVAVEGVCLTVVERHPGGFTCDVLAETMQRTSLGGMQPGSRLNLERALLAGDLLGGHVVSGHVDGTGRVAAVREIARDAVMRIACGSELMDGIVQRGSVACAGVGLTVSGLDADWFEVNLIPLTRKATTLGECKTGDEINVELDMIGKYVKRYAAGTTANTGLSVDDLRRTGFA